jgi:hypothetical protein
MAALSNVSGSNRGYLSQNAGVMDAASGNASSCTTYGVFAENCGVVNAGSVNASGAGTAGFGVATGGVIDITSATGTTNIAANLQRREGLITDNGQANISTISSQILTYSSSSVPVLAAQRWRSGASLSISTDAVATLDMVLIGSAEWGILTLSSSSTGAGNPNGQIRYRVGTSPATDNVSLITTTNVVLTTGVLTGTTGSPGDFTISAATDGKIYLENRTAASKSIRLHAAG